MSAAPLPLHTCPPGQSPATSHWGTAALRGFQGITVPRTATAKLTAQASQLLHSQHLIPGLGVQITLQKPMVVNVFIRFKV